MLVIIWLQKDDESDATFARPSLTGNEVWDDLGFDPTEAKRRQGNEAKTVCASDIFAWTLCRARDSPGKHNRLSDMSCNKGRI